MIPSIEAIFLEISGPDDAIKALRTHIWRLDYKCQQLTRILNETTCKLNALDRQHGAVPYLVMGVNGRPLYATKTALKPNDISERVHANDTAVRTWVRNFGRNRQSRASKETNDELQRAWSALKLKAAPADTGACTKSFKP